MSPTPPLRRVHPGPATSTTVDEAYRVDTRVRRRRDESPWVGVCMVASLDGSVTVEGTSGGLGNENDRDILLTLRERADVVIVGAATVAGEGYQAPRSDIRIGVVTNSGRVDPTSELFRSGSGFVITAEETAVGDLAAAGVDIVRAGRTRVDLALALLRLEEIVPRVDRVHAEGGPSLNAALLHDDLVDEIALTIAPMMVGGAGPRVTATDAEFERRFELAHLLIDDDGYTFGRWIRRRATDD